MGNFFTGLAVILVGLIVAIWGKKFDEFIPFTYGRQIFGSGAVAYQVIGVAITILGFFIMFGFFQLSSTL